MNQQPTRYTVAVLCLVAVAALLAACGAGQHTARVGFWFETPDYQLDSLDVERLGGPLTADERQRIEATARTELRAAFAGLRVAVSEDSQAFYRVKVVPGPLLPFGAVGHSRILFGGQGAVSFLTLASQAIAYAPPGTGRAGIVDGIGRGIGRAAAHEFAHQMLPGVNIHARAAADSYEYGTAARAAEFYGPIRWDTAWPALKKRYGH